MLKKILIPILVILTGCATQYPGPRSDSNSQVFVKASGLHPHPAYPDDKLLVRVFLGKQPQLEGVGLGAITLTPEKLSSEFKLDQGVEYTLWVSTIESNFGGFTSCGFVLPLTPEKDESYSIEFQTRKVDCDVLVSTTNKLGTKAKVLEATNVAGRTQFRVKVVRY